MIALPEEVTAKAFILAKKMAAKMMEVLHCDGVNVVQNNGEAAGQTVFHFHIHLIPRYEGDGAGVTWAPGTNKGRDLKSICGLIDKSGRQK